MGLIRLLLALSVVATHCGTIFGFELVGGKVAVQSFYIISGFYMSLVLNEKYIGINNSYRLFITNRFIRLYPIYWTVLLGTILICIALIVASDGHHLLKFESWLSVRQTVSSFTFLVVSNIFIFGQDIVMFLGINPREGTLYFTSNFWNTNPPLHNFLFVPQSWTLGLELTFYLLAPFMLRKGFKIIFVLIALSFLLRLFIYNFLSLQNDPWNYRFFPTEIMFFLFGYVSYRIHLRLKTKSIPKTFNLFVVFYILAYTLIYPYISEFKVHYSPFSFKEIIYFLSIILLIPVLFNYLKKSKLDNQIGELSYPVYISHLGVAMVCGVLPFTFLRSGWAIALLTVIIAYLLNKFIAYPIERFRQSRVKKPAPISAQIQGSEIVLGIA